MSVSQASPGIVAELLEIAIHNILYSRKVYPEAAFQRSRKYNIPIQAMCGVFPASNAPATRRGRQVAVHPRVVDYIDSCVMTMHKLLHRNESRKMVLHIADAAHNPVEQFVVRRCPSRSDGAPTSNGSNKMEEDSYLLDVEAAARAICLRVSTSDVCAAGQPRNGCSFNIQLHVARKHSHDGCTLSDDPDDRSVSMGRSGTAKTPTFLGGSIIPLKCANITVGKVHLYVVESDVKGSKWYILV
uniref:Putative mitotic spindle checkpoint protein n=1 Tax=Ixodes ricinus TaxID=34613 RepID=A0A090X922_IXORI